MSLHPDARAAFARVEDARWLVEEGRFDSTGQLSWASTTAYEALPEPRMRVAPTRAQAAQDEATVGSGGGVAWVPSKGAAVPPVKGRLKRWLGMDDAARESFRTRAARHIPDWALSEWLEYAAFCLFARGRGAPVSRPEFRAALKTQKKGGL